MMPITRRRMALDRNSSHWLPRLGDDWEAQAGLCLSGEGAIALH
jgi:hypothetical protein